MWKTIKKNQETLNIKTENTQNKTEEMKNYFLDRNLKVRGKYYKKGHKFNEFDENFDIFKNFIQ